MTEWHQASYIPLIPQQCVNNHNFSFIPGRTCLVSYAEGRFFDGSVHSLRKRSLLNRTCGYFGDGATGALCKRWERKRGPFRVCFAAGTVRAVYREKQINTF